MKQLLKFFAKLVVIFGFIFFIAMTIVLSGCATAPIETIKQAEPDYTVDVHGNVVFKDYDTALDYAMRDPGTCLALLIGCQNSYPYMLAAVESGDMTEAEFNEFMDFAEELYNIYITQWAVSEQEVL